jgi:hypothetical protein
LPYFHRANRDRLRYAEIIEKKFKENRMKTLYEQDYGLWAEKMACLLEEGKFSELDIENLVRQIVWESVDNL